MFTPAFTQRTLCHYLCCSDYVSVLLIVANNPLFKHAKLVLKLVRTWCWGTILAFWDCFECRDCNIFKEVTKCNHSADLQVYRASVIGYICKCLDYEISPYADQKPRKNAGVLKPKMLPLD